MVQQQSSQPTFLATTGFIQDGPAQRLKREELLLKATFNSPEFYPVQYEEHHKKPWREQINTEC